MESVSNVLFWISNGLLVPVLVGLLFLFARSLLLLGGFYGEYLERRRMEKSLSIVLNGLQADHIGMFAEVLEEQKITPFVESASRLLQPGMTVVHREHLIGEYEIQSLSRLNVAKNLTKFGPILGLMGTLIPMGPALVGLSTGDIGSMAYNMQVAFATTVIGLFAGAIGYILLQVKQKWMDTDLLTLDFLAGLLAQNENIQGKEPQQ